MALTLARRPPVVLRGYRRLLVPVVANPESVRAVEIACRLAAEDHPSITALTVIEVPALLPLDAHMVDAEDEASQLLERVGATGDGYGVNVSRQLVRARAAGAAIIDTATTTGTELIVIGAPRRRLRSSRGVVFGTTVEHVLRGAPCRVMIVTASSEAEAA